MKLPVIKALTEFMGNHDQDYVHEAIEVLEHVSQAKGLSDEELDTIGELLSNMYGSIEVSKMVKEGKTQNDALNHFMKRVLGSIDK